jgi:hypothetical protein
MESPTGIRYPSCFEDINHERFDSIPRINLKRNVFRLLGAISWDEPLEFDCLTSDDVWDEN